MRPAQSPWLRDLVDRLVANGLRRWWAWWLRRQLHGPRPVRKHGRKLTKRERRAIVRRKVPT